MLVLDVRSGEYWVIVGDTESATRGAAIPAGYTSCVEITLSFLQGSLSLSPRTARSS